MPDECPTLRYITRVVERLFDSARSQVVREWWDVILPLVQQEQPCPSSALRQQLAECERQRDRAEGLLAEARLEVEEHDASFNLRWKADMRAIKRWQDATGSTLVWPDHADLCVWLLTKLDAALAAKTEAEKRAELYRIALVALSPEAAAALDPAEPAGKEGE